MKKLFFILIIITFTLNAQSKYDNKISHCYNLIYEFKFDEAEKLLFDLIEDDPKQAEPYQLLSQIHLWFYLGCKDEGEIKIYEEYADSALTKAEIQLNDNPDNPKNHLLLGNIKMLEALAATSRDEMLSAFWSSKSSMGYFKDALSIDPELYDAHLGIGLFNYALSFIPGMFKWAASLTGLTADKRLGFENIRIAYKFGKNSRYEAGFHLAKLYSEYLAEYDSAMTVIGKLTKRFKRNTLFHYQEAVIAIQSRKFDRAERSLNKVLLLDHPKFSLTKSLTYFLLGEVEYRKNHFEKSIEWYTKFIDSTKVLDYTGIANLQIALSYSILGDDLKFQKHLLLAKNGNKDIWDDIIASEKSNYFFDNPPDSVYKQLIKIQNDLLIGGTNVLDSLQNLDIDSTKQDHLAFYDILNSEAYFNKKDYKRSVECAENVLRYKVKNEFWTRPYANIILAKNYFSIGEKKLAEDYLEDALDDNEFRFKNFIEANANNLKRKIRKFP
ncbi:MAG: hypothetical protein J5I57_03315 [Melioribacteraceae bacterium]|nr:hypothetical protein [Melioribacteraceae bacterium]